jgi:hypothetical protein
MPFTDPMADGPAIQSANLRSLGAGTTTADVLRYGHRVPRAAPGHAAGADGLCQPDGAARAGVVRRGRRKAGVDGVICVDIPPEEDDDLGPALRAPRASPRSASPRRPPTPRACRRCSMARRASSTTSRSPGSPASSRPQIASDRGQCRAHQAIDRPAGRGRLRRAHARTGRRDRQGGGRRGGRLGAGRAGRRIWRDHALRPLPARPCEGKATARPSCARRSIPREEAACMNWLTRVRNSLPFAQQARRPPRTCGSSARAARKCCSSAEYEANLRSARGASITAASAPTRGLTSCSIPASRCCPMPKVAKTRSSSATPRNTPTG